MLLHSLSLETRSLEGKDLRVLGNTHLVLPLSSHSPLSFEQLVLLYGAWHQHLEASQLACQPKDAEGTLALAGYLLLHFTMLDKWKLKTLQKRQFL